jgi:glycosyltransferase involved in cell wall biosynthesis
MELSLIIPARNEARRIEATLVAYAEAFAQDAEVIVAVNDSNDATVEIARRLAASHPNVIVLEITQSVGKGGSVRAGFERARGTYVGFVDADMATTPTEFRRILTAATQADGAIGSRWARGATVIGRSPLRAVASRAFITLVQALFGLRYADTQCGAKVFHRRFLPAYLAASRVSDLAFDVELLLILKRAGARLVEVPTVWVSQPGSAALGSPLGFLRHAVTMVRSLMRLWWWTRHPGAVSITTPASPSLTPAEREAAYLKTVRGRPGVSE